MIQIAVMGHGVVGSGVTEILLSHGDEIAKKVFRSLEDERSTPKLLKKINYPFKKNNI